VFWAAQGSPGAKVAGNRCLVPDAWRLVPGTRPWNPAPGYLIPGGWYQVPGTGSTWCHILAAAWGHLFTLLGLLWRHWGCIFCTKVSPGMVWLRMGVTQECFFCKQLRLCTHLFVVLSSDPWGKHFAVVYVSVASKCRQCCGTGFWDVLEQQNGLRVKAPHNAGWVNV